jgi:hypothetical protein
MGRRYKAGGAKVGGRLCHAGNEAKYLFLQTAVLQYRAGSFERNDVGSKNKLTGVEWSLYSFLMKLEADTSAVF